MGLSSKFRIGQVAGALSSGLGLFAEKKWKEEQEAEERAWQQHLQNIADARAEARSEVDFQRRLAISMRDNALADQRTAADRNARSEERRLDRDARAKEGELNRGAQTDQFFWRLQGEGKERMNAQLESINEREEKMLEMPQYQWDDSGARQKLMDDFEKERESVRATYAQSMMDLADMHPDVDAFSQFRADSEDDVRAIFQSTGMDSKNAGERATAIWGWRQSQMGLGEAGAGGSPEPGPGGIPYLDAEPYSGGSSSAPPPPTGPAAQVDPTPRTPMPEAGPQTQEPSPGSLNQLFNAEPITNPDGTPKYPANRESLGYKLFDWMQQPTPYGQ